MSSPRDADAVFDGSVPELYDRYLVPLIFEEYAADLAERVSDLPAGDVLELACGTGVVTRALAQTLGPELAITATDLNQAMLDRAAGIGTSRPIHWRQADALELPFPDDSFDAVLCQFGVMFFPDKPRAFAEAHRVLRPGGRLVFNTWGPIADNELADVVTMAVGTLWPRDPPVFLDRTPHGYHDPTVILAQLVAGGFDPEQVGIDMLDCRSVAPVAEDPAIAYCQGTPLREEIVARDPDALAHATAVATAAIVDRFGPGPVDARISGLVVTAAA